jgi:hypothetical protein
MSSSTTTAPHLGERLSGCKPDAEAGAADEGDVAVEVLDSVIVSSPLT